MPTDLTVGIFYSGAPRRLADADLAKFAGANRHTSVCLFAAVPNPLVGFEPLGVQQFNEKHRARRCPSLNWRAQKDSNPQPSDP